MESQRLIQGIGHNIMNAQESHRSITLAEVLIVSAIVIALAMFPALRVHRTRQLRLRTMCVNQLLQIDTAKKQWEVETFADLTYRPTKTDLSANIQGGIDVLICPKSGRSFEDSYTIGAMSNMPQCKIDRTHML